MSMDWKEHDRQSEAPQGEKSKISVALIAWIVVAVLALVFILQNTSKATVHFLFFDFTAGKWFALLVAVLLGVLLDRAFLWWWRRRKAESGKG